MSRGLGQLQQRILAEVERTRNKPTTFETLRWAIWDGEAPSDGKLPQRLNTSVDRGVKSLVQRGHLIADSRPLADLDEWVTHYPGKTLNIQIRELRKEFLPHIAAWLGSGDGPRAKFSKAENEEFAARKLTPDQMEGFRSLWANLEPSLRQCYGNTGTEHLFLLLVRGKQLFTRWSGVSTSISLGELVMRCSTEQDVSEQLRRQLHALMNKFLPGTSARTLEFKSYIRAVAKHVPTSGHCALSEDAEDELYKRCGERLSQLPGFKCPPVSEKRDIFLQFETQPHRPRHSPLLKKILDHSVFQDFRFLTV